ncbi:MAG: prolyl-tRNA synthetase associated domain-containing protein [Brotaphodocola sp.]
MDDTIKNTINSAESKDSFYMDPILYEGRPTDETGRLPKEIRTYDLLDQLQIPYWRLDHDATFSIEACHDVDKRLDIEICKNLFLCNAQKTDFYLLMMPGHKKFKTAKLSSQIGSARLSFAGPEFMEEFLDITPGSVSVLGLMNDKNKRVRLLIDKDVVDHHAFIGCHPCINTSSIKVATSDILEKFLPYVEHPYTLVELPWED